MRKIKEFGGAVAAHMAAELVAGGIRTVIAKTKKASNIGAGFIQQKILMEAEWTHPIDGHMTRSEYRCVREFVSDDRQFLMLSDQLDYANYGIDIVYNENEEIRVKFRKLQDEHGELFRFIQGEFLIWLYLTRTRREFAQFVAGLDINQLQDYFDPWIERLRANNEEDASNQLKNELLDAIGIERPSPEEAQVLVIFRYMTDKRSKSADKRFKKFRDEKISYPVSTEAQFNQWVEKAAKLYN